MIIMIQLIWSYISMLSLCAFLCRYIDLDIIIAVQDKAPEEQDVNNALFDVVIPGRVYELMAHDEEEKIRYLHTHNQQQ